MLLFYLVAGALAVLTALALVRPLVRGTGREVSRAAADAALYRDQLAEVERDLARGAITPAEAEGARAEVSRRLLAVAGQGEPGQGEPGQAEAGPGQAPRRLSRLAAGMGLIGAPVLAVAVYLAIGAPALVDSQPPARLSQAEVEAMMPPRDDSPPPEGMEEYAQLIERLERVMQERPADTDGLELLATGYVRLGRHAEGWRAWQRLIELAGDAAEAEHYAAMAEAMVLAAGGYVSPEAEAALGEALSRDPGLPLARYYRALGLAQSGRLEPAIAAWEGLRAEAPEGAPWLDFLDRTLAEARAMRDGAAPAAEGAPGTGPTGADIAAAEALSPEERQAMIEGMVARLEDRLTSEGGEPEEWLRLMRAYMQLDRPEDAARVAALGIEAFGSDSAADFLREQALLMGLEPQ